MTEPTAPNCPEEQVNYNGNGSWHILSTIKCIVNIIFNRTNIIIPEPVPIYIFLFLVYLCQRCQTF